MIRIVSHLVRNALNHRVVGEHETLVIEIPEPIPCLCGCDCRNAIVEHLTIPLAVADRSKVVGSRHLDVKSFLCNGFVFRRLEAALILEVELAKIILVILLPHLLFGCSKISTPVLEKPNPVVLLTLRHIGLQALLDLLNLVAHGLKCETPLGWWVGEKLCLRKLIAVALHVALTAVCVVCPQLGRHATSTARLRILLRAEVAHPPRTIALALRLVHTAPDLLLCLIGEIPGAVVTRLLAAITHADIVALVLALMAEVRQNDCNQVAVRAPAIGGGECSVAWVVAHRHAGVTVVTPENGRPCVATTGATYGPHALSAHGSGNCGIPAVGGDAEEEVRVGNGHFACDGEPHFYLCRAITESVFRIRSWAKI